MIPITKPYFDEAEEKALLKVLQSGWLVQGPKVAAFEERVANYCGAKYGIAVSSCTAALHLGLLALGVGPGDEVIVPSFTFVASANAIEYCGATPVFCDIDLKTFTIDLSQIESLITDNTKAIMPVSLFGMPLDMASLRSLAEKNGLSILEDAACALGAESNGRNVGGQGADAVAFSFHPRKVITTGEGGMLLTDSDEIATAVCSYRNHGATQSDLERHQKGVALLSPYELLGYNYRMTDMQGVLGLEQMSKLPTLLGSRKQAAEIYDSLLGELDWIIPPSRPSGGVHGYQSYVVLLSSGDKKLPDFSDVIELGPVRTRLMTALKEVGISVRQGTHAVHEMPFYKEKYSLESSMYPNSFTAHALSIALPLYHGISDSDLERVVTALAQFAQN